MSDSNIFTRVCELTVELERIDKSISDNHNDLLDRYSKLTSESRRDSWLSFFLKIGVGVVIGTIITTAFLFNLYRAQSVQLQKDKIELSIEQEKFKADKLTYDAAKKELEVKREVLLKIPAPIERRLLDGTVSFTSVRFPTGHKVNEKNEYLAISVSESSAVKDLISCDWITPDDSAKKKKKTLCVIPFK